MIFKKNLGAEPLMQFTSFVQSEIQNCLPSVHIALTHPAALKLIEQLCTLQTVYF